MENLSKQIEKKVRRQKKQMFFMSLFILSALFNALFFGITEYFKVNIEIETIVFIITVFEAIALSISYHAIRD